MSHFVLELKKVSKTYGVCRALSNIHLGVSPGDVYGIIGHSGAGKTTLLRCMSSMETPTEGEVLFKGISLKTARTKSLRAIRREMGMIFQHFNLLNSRTARENIAYPLEIANVPRIERERRVDELLERVRLSDKQHVYPAFLSGGQKQRVGIARALACNPSILFCDEATSSLDPSATQQVLQLLKTLKDQLGLTIVLITHEMDVVRQICTKVAVLDQGMIVEQGSVVNVFSNPQSDIARKFLQQTAHEIPFEALHLGKKLYRLGFHGQAAKEPVISSMIRQFNVDANILQGWLDYVQGETVGNLLIELLGSEQNISHALAYLRSRNVRCETVEKP